MEHKFLILILYFFYLNFKFQIRSYNHIISPSFSFIIFICVFLVQDHVFIKLDIFHWISSFTNLIFFIFYEFYGNNIKPQINVRMCFSSIFSTFLHQISSRDVHLFYFHFYFIFFSFVTKFYFNEIFQIFFSLFSILTKILNLLISKVQHFE